MTYAEFKQEIRDRVIPDGDSARLDPRHDGWILNLLIELQRKVPCLRTQHKEYIQQAATFTWCGAVAMPYPLGTVTKITGVRVNPSDNSCKFVDAVPYTEAVFKGIFKQQKRCGYNYVTAGGSTGYDTTYGEEYDYGSKDPDLRPTTEADDTSCSATGRAYAIFDGYVWLWPMLNSDETAVLQWTGIKRHWEDTDEIPWEDEAGSVDPELLDAAVSGFSTYFYKFTDCDSEKASMATVDWRKKLAELIINCEKSLTPEEMTVITGPNCAC